ncbi:MAG: aminoacyl-tRNA hydrolase [Flavobacteriales bacterium]|nr:aminoacyl-tRNA hydrolase [Flavobacteriales bacterium]
MKYLIVGLGNPGTEYENTRHNIGFKVLDAFVKASGTSFEQDRHADIARVRHRGRTIVLLKPNTFMNLSGKAVRYWMQAEKIPSDRILIITDDLAIPFGKLRLRAKGSDGGHNGLANIIQVLGSAQWPRLRFGIGSEFKKGKQVNYVLSPWHTEEEDQLPERLEMCVKLIVSFCTVGLARTMSDFNNK